MWVVYRDDQLSDMSNLIVSANKKGGDADKSYGINSKQNESSLFFSNYTQNTRLLRSLTPLFIHKKMIATLSDTTKNPDTTISLVGLLMIFDP